MKITEVLISMATEMEKDEEKFIKGNASAGTRLRAGLMGIKKFCDAQRKEIQAAKNAERTAE